MKEKYKTYFYGFGAFAFFCIIMGMLMACHFVTELNKKNFEVNPEQNDIKNEKKLYPSLHETDSSPPVAPNRAPPPTRNPPPPPSTPVSAPAPAPPPPVTPVSAPAPPPPPTNQENLADNLYSEQKELDNILQSLNSIDFGDAPSNPPPTKLRSVSDLNL